MKNIRLSVQGFRWGQLSLPTILGLLALVVVIASAGCGGSSDTKAPTTSATTPVSSSATLEVPITVSGASNLGSLQFELRFDPQVLELKGVKTGPLAHNALVDSNVSSPGRVQIGLVAASGISGDGSIIVLTFAPGENKSADLIVEQLQAADTDLRDLVVTASPGRYSGTGSQANGPELSFRR